MKIKNLLIAIIIPVIRLLGYMFYDKKYLNGRWFENRKTGYKWVLQGLWYQKLLGFNRNIPFPASPFTTIIDYKNIHFHNDDLNNFQSPGCYFQCGKGHIYRSWDLYRT